ncbi:hypothetical protein EW146_g3424 [Bondarzewia mesenterica]|uniref:Uncharacterized protein n=1 Tax=Bondarzewia mesenterica TaxID=1095465 RepID=A0A4S4LZT5_9AGAM|nr:hypothetical protein EW146_g3424 [Bondarzewia mesenterica]
MEGPSKRKVTAKVDLSNVAVNRPRSRPTSPFKSPPPTAPLLRPRAKINGSASIVSRKASSTVGFGNRVPISPNTRPNSPFKPLKSLPNGSSSSARSVVDVPPFKPKAPVAERVVARQRSLTGSTSDPSFMMVPRARRGSGSLHPKDTPSNLTQVSPELSSNTHLSPPPVSAPVAGVMRVKSKVTSLAKAPSSTVSLPSSPSFATTRPTHLRARAPSISSVTLNSVPPSPTPSSSVCYPITVASPAANPHRYTSLRATPPTNTHRFQPFAANDDSSVHYNAKFIQITPKVDPSVVSPHPQSPPASTVSFSSRSSQSSASQHTQNSDLTQSTAPTLNSPMNGWAMVDRDRDEASSQRSCIDGLPGVQGYHSRRTSLASMNGFQGAPGIPRGDPERKIKAEAKSNRKIEDLKITNRSLLAINSTLEATKHKQAKEIRDLRRKLRESRLILPPRTYRAVKSSFEPEELNGEDDDDEEDTEDGEGGTEESFARQDATYRRVKELLDGLLESGKRALAATPDDFMEGETAGAKVLSAEEAPSILDVTTDAESDAEGPPLSPAHVAVSDDEDDFQSEDEVEAMMDSELDIVPPSRVPPITVTFS